MEDFFIAHIGGMDTYARGLRAAAKIIEDGVLEQMVQDRYSSFDCDLGRDLESGRGDLETFASRAHDIGEPEKRSAQQELYENIFAEYIR